MYLKFVQNTSWHWTYNLAYIGWLAVHGAWFNLTVCVQFATLSSSRVPSHIAAIYCPTAARNCSRAYACRRLPLFQGREISTNWIVRRGTTIDIFWWWRWLFRCPEYGSLDRTTKSSFISMRQFVHLGFSIQGQMRNKHGFPSKS